MTKKRKLWIIPTVIIIILAIIIGLALIIRSETTASEISVDEAQSIIDKTLSETVGSSDAIKDVIAKSEIKVNSVEYGEEKDAVLSCSYNTVDVFKVIKDNADFLLSIDTVSSAGIQKSATAIRLELSKDISELLGNAEPVSGEVEIHLYDMDKAGFVPYWSDEVLNSVFGGITDAKNYVNSLESITVDGKTVSIETRTNLKNGLIQCVSISSAYSSKPDTNNFVMKKWNGFKHEFMLNFGNGNWRYITNGLLNTLKITLCAVLIGIVIGFLVAIIRCTNQSTGKLKIPNFICTVYLTVIRGTPVMVQLLIVYFVMLLPLGVAKLPAAILCFGFNSGAYVAEIVRGGIMSIDKGQMEAGRSLGFNYPKTMWYIIIPQAFKAVLPALANEFIVLLKETSVAAYIGVADLTRGGEIIRGFTFSNFMPLLAVAIIYLVMVVILTQLVNLLERKLRNSDH